MADNACNQIPIVICGECVEAIAISKGRSPSEYLKKTKTSITAYIRMIKNDKSSCQDYH